MKGWITIVLAAALLSGCRSRESAEASIPTEPVEIDRSSRPAESRVPVRSTAIPLVPDADSLGIPLVTADKREFRELLKARKFVALDEALERWEKAYERDPLLERAFLDALDAFSDPDPRLQPLFDAWSAARPNSHFPHLGRAYYEVENGWESRGTKFIRKTSWSQLRGMHAAFDRAAEHLAKVSARHPECLGIFHGMSRMAIASGSASERKRILRDGLAKHPDSRALRWIYMESLEPRWGGSYAKMNAFADEIDRDAKRNRALKVFRGFIASDRGHVAAENDDDARAVKEYTTALSFGPAWNAYASRARSLWRLGRKDEALLDFDAAAKIAPQRVDFMDDHARLLAERGPASAARKRIELLKSLRGPNKKTSETVSMAAPVLAYRGWELAKEGKTREGLLFVDDAIAIDPRSADARMWRGHVFRLQGADEEALKAFEEAVRLDPNHFEAHRAVDYVYARRGEWSRIVRMWDAFLARNPGHAGAFRERAGTKKHQGDLEGARADMKKSCALGDEQACGYAARL